MFSNIIRYCKYFSFPFKVFLKRKKYENIIAWQQFYGLMYAFYCRLFHVKKHNKLIVMTFIYKEKQGFLGKIYYKFMKYIVQSKYVDKFVCFSEKECEYYAKVFNVSQDKFRFCNLGIEEIIVENNMDNSQKSILSCGRSNRDYDFLYNALKDKDYILNIISDECKLKNYKNVTIYNDVIGQDYLNMLSKAYLVVIPLKDENISSGQLVILQAMQLGKPIICTSSEAVKEYIKDGVNGFIIKKDENKLLEKIEELYSNKELYDRISKAQKENFEDKFSIYALGNKVGEIFNNAKND